MWLDPLTGAQQLFLSAWNHRSPMPKGHWQHLWWMEKAHWLILCLTTHRGQKGSKGRRRLSTGRKSSFLPSHGGHAQQKHVICDNAALSMCSPPLCKQRQRQGRHKTGILLLWASWAVASSSLAGGDFRFLAEAPRASKITYPRPKTGGATKRTTGGGPSRTVQGAAAKTLKSPFRLGQLGRKSPFPSAAEGNVNGRALCLLGTRSVAKVSLGLRTANKAG